MVLYMETAVWQTVLPMFNFLVVESYHVLLGQFNFLSYYLLLLLFILWWACLLEGIAFNMHYILSFLLFFQFLFLLFTIL